ncbi:TPA: GMP synthase (glutamine-hydrolyzing), partial [candidate division WOR-3 bacterium]|nr:GMP synthase (glutamine-hydrolyzing) [candidate division WOR-3 bacterium]
REMKVYSEIISPSVADKFNYSTVSGIILSGGPNSVYDKESPTISNRIFSLDIPILGICYGMQLIAIKNSGVVSHSQEREYGRSNLTILSRDVIFKAVKNKSIVWMSHSDKVKEIPKGYVKIAMSENSETAAMKHSQKQIYGFQFHPEVHHTQFGYTMLHNFVIFICRAKQDWTSKNFIERTVEEIKEQANGKIVISGISGGVDSTVASVLVKRAVGKHLKGFLIDTGLLRYNEGRETVECLKRTINMDVEYVDSAKLFLRRLKNVEDPEEKRRIIGKTFIEVFADKAKSFKNAEFLVQGTIYPDRIESQSQKGPSHVIKTHHNVGGLPKNMKFKLIEPLKELFKDEVRRIGIDLEIPSELILRHPFPGPGLGIRILGAVTEESVIMLQKADKIYLDVLKERHEYGNIWQAFAVLLPVKTVGVMGDQRTYDNVIALRAVTSVDGMTADWYGFSKETLQEISKRIINEVKGVNRVVYDISTKPPSTIEWE